jgi:hypothetical protein
MPYVLRRGTIYGKPYKCGEFVPGVKGELADMEAAGVVEWVDAPVREAKPKAAPKPAAKRKAVK